MNKLLLVGSLVCASPLSFAQFAQAEGEFSSRSLELRTILLDSEKGVVAAAATVVEGACSGSVAGIGRISGKTLIFTPHVKIEGGESCSITAEFDSKWKRVKVTEGRNCTPYHGASCAWEGQVASKRPAPRR